MLSLPTLMRTAVCTGLLVLALPLGAATVAMEDIPEADAELLRAARTASERYRGHLDSLLRQAQSGDPEQRRIAIRALAHTLDRTIIPHLISFIDLDDQPTDVVIAACHAVSVIGATQAEPALRAVLGADNAEIDRAARNALAQLELQSPPDYIQEADFPDPDVRASGVTNIGTREVQEAGMVLVEALGDRSVHIRRMAAIGLGRLGKRELGEQLLEGLTDPDPLVRRYTAESLAKLDYTPAIPFLLIALEGRIAGADIARSLKILAGDDFGWKLSDTPAGHRRAIERGFSWWTANAERLRE